MTVFASMTTEYLITEYDRKRNNLKEVTVACFQVQYWHSLQTLRKAIKISMRLTGIENLASALLASGA
jgi:hypothetical protein